MNYTATSDWQASSTSHAPEYFATCGHVHPWGVACSHAGVQPPLLSFSPLADEPAPYSDEPRDDEPVPEGDEPGDFPTDVVEDAINAEAELVPPDY